MPAPRERARRPPMSRRTAASEIRLPDHEESIPPVTILDGQGRLVRVVPAQEFRRTPVAPTPPASRVPPRLAGSRPR